jgi:type VI secretion system protein VasD
MDSKAGRTVVGYYFLCIFSGIFLSGCGLLGALKFDEGETPSLPLEIGLSATEGVNPDIEGQPSPIAVRLFELSNDTRFLAADYFELMGQDGAPLGDELLVSEQLILMPGEVQMIRKRIKANSKFLGIAASYRDLNSSAWRVVAALPETYFAGGAQSDSVPPIKRLYVVLDEKGAAIYEKQPTIYEKQPK